MKLTSTESKQGLAFLATGVIVALAFAAIGALETQRPLHAVLWSFIAFVFYVGIFELASLLKTSTRKSIGLAAVAGIVASFCGLAAAIEIARGQDWLALPQSWVFWILPAAVAIGSLYELKRKRRPESGN
jgi:hypothetical protein